MDDLISRQAALDAFGLSEKTRKYGGDHSGYDTIMLYEVQDVLEALPPVQPKQKTGHWILLIHELYACSECHSKWTMKLNYCPYCGAKMIEPQERSDKG